MRPEPVAIVGIAALYPEARGVEAFWRLVSRPGERDANREPGGLDDVEVDVARFGIPPAQAKSMAKLQVLMLEVARHCLTDAGYAGRALPSERVDVVVGSCFGLDRQYANALRIHGVRYASELEQAAAVSTCDAAREHAVCAGEELRALLGRRLGGSPHDRVGEMAGTIPARIAAAFKLRGRTLAVESADATAFLAIRHAVNGLRDGSCDAALVLAGQRRESDLIEGALRLKGLTDPRAAGSGFTLGEGVGALLLKRLSSAVRDGDRVYASILADELRHDARPGLFRYSTSISLRRETAEAAYRHAGVEPASVQYVERVDCGTGEAARAGTAALAELHGADTGLDGADTGLHAADTELHAADAVQVAVGSVQPLLGHTFANAGLAAITATALALYHRVLPPFHAQHLPASDLATVPDLTGTAFTALPAARDWPSPESGGARRAAVTGASVTGTVAHLVLEAFDSQAPAARATRTQPVPGRQSPEPIAVIAMSACFAGAPDVESFQRVTASGRDAFAPLPAEVLDRELYYAPDSLSLDRSYTQLGAYVAPPRERPGAPPITPRRFAALDGVQRLALAASRQLLDGVGERLRGTGIVALGASLSPTLERDAVCASRLPELEAAAADPAVLGGLPAEEITALLELVRKRYDAPDVELWHGSLDGYLASGVAALLANEYRLPAVPVAVEAACASSAAALDVAVCALRSGMADFAIVGGAELPCNTRDLVLCSALGLLSHDRITPFDAAADGFTPGDGCALFVLKRHGDALRDGDPIHGLVRSVGASNDAKSLVAPDADGQERAMRRAFDQVDFGPGDVDFLEAHGTGTRVGDQVEIAAAARVYAAERRRPLMIGSVKSYIGHTFAAAGAAGLLRALLAVRDGTLPPNANIAAVNPALDLAAIPAAIATSVTPWPREPGRPRRAAVNSFGTGGINYHLLIEENPD